MCPHAGRWTRVDKDEACEEEEEADATPERRFMVSSTDPLVSHY